MIKHRGPWRTVEQVEFATAEWVDWFNHRRLYEYCGDIPPAELEAAYYRQYQPRLPGRELRNKVTGHAGAIQEAASDKIKRLKDIRDKKIAHEDLGNPIPLTASSMYSCAKCGNLTGGLSLLTPHEQWDLHNFYLVTQETTDAELRLHRRLVKQVDPSLPQRAGRAYTKLQRGDWKRIDYAVTPKGRAITIRTVVKPKPDLDHPRTRNDTFRVQPSSAARSSV